jgi:hypothetical protein
VGGAVSVDYVFSFFDDLFDYFVRLFADFFRGPRPPL